MLTVDYKRLLSALFLTDGFTLQRQIQRKASQNGITEIHRTHTQKNQLYPAITPPKFGTHIVD